jgi:hypothetical protein
MKWWMAAFALAASSMTLAGCSSETGIEARGDDLAVRPGCEAVRCPMPLCVQGQHLAYQGSCCPTCVGPEPRCADVACPMYLCAQGTQLVTPPGQCCGRCQPTAPAAECATDLDCPQLECFRCPCPVATCQGRRCVTSTPSASTCGGL